MTPISRLFILFLWLLSGCVFAQTTPLPARTYQFVVTELPPNTPHDARLFLTGNFTTWNPGNPAYQFIKESDGSYRLTLTSALPLLEFKVTRGNWESVEGRDGGRARANRRLVPDQANSGIQLVEMAIMSWEDLSGTFHFYSVYDLLMLFSAFQAFLLLVAIPTIQNYNRSANRWLGLLLGLTALLLFIRTVSSYRVVAQTYTKLLLIPDLVLFLYAPLFYVYLRKLLFATTRPASGWWRHFVPALIQLGIYMPYLLSNDKLFQIKIVNRDPWLYGLFVGMGLLGLVYNSGYWLFCRRAIRSYETQHEMRLSTEPQVRYLNTVLLIQAVCLGAWAFFFGILTLSSLLDMDTLSIAEKSVDLIWLIFSCIVYLLGYYAIHQPEIFKLPDTEHIPLLDSGQAQPEQTTEGASPDVPDYTMPPVEEVSVKPPAETVSESSEAIRQMRMQIDSHMKRHKPYINPTITLPELATRLRLPVHLLSKVLNDEYKMNFFDFINYHRIEELKSRLTDPKFRSYTVLSMAFEVGFNSKTAFNRSFKKLTNQTPSEYLQLHGRTLEVVE